MRALLCVFLSATETMNWTHLEFADAQGGPDPSTKHEVYFNQWEDLDDSPIGWHITEVCASMNNLCGE